MYEAQQARRTFNGTQTVTPGASETYSQQMPTKITYRIELPTMVLAFRDNHQSAVTIPTGQIIEVIGPAEDERFVVVSMGDEQFHIFASDLETRATQIKAVRAGK